jgi:hypothetical protein
LLFSDNFISEQFFHYHGTHVHHTWFTHQSWCVHVR